MDVIGVTEIRRADQIGLYAPRSKKIDECLCECLDPASEGKGIEARQY